MEKSDCNMVNWLIDVIPNIGDKTIQGITCKVHLFPKWSPMWSKCKHNDCSRYLLNVGYGQKTSIMFCIFNYILMIKIQQHEKIYWKLMMMEQKLTWKRSGTSALCKKTVTNTAFRPDTLSQSKQRRRITLCRLCSTSVPFKETTMNWYLLICETCHLLGLMKKIHGLPRPPDLQGTMLKETFPFFFYIPRDLVSRPQGQLLHL